jgi:hypothetical protein
MAKAKKTSSSRISVGNKSSNKQWHNLLYSKWLVPSVFIFAFAVGGAAYLAISYAATIAKPITVIVAKAPALDPSANPTPPVAQPYLTQETLGSNSGKIIYVLPTSYTGPGTSSFSAVSYDFYVNPTVPTNYGICASVRRDVGAAADQLKVEFSGTPVPANRQVAGTSTYLYICTGSKLYYPINPHSPQPGYNLFGGVINADAKSNLRVLNIALVKWPY